MSEDPRAISKSEIMKLLKYILFFFDEVLILKNFSRKACFCNAPEELSTF